MNIEPEKTEAYSINVEDAAHIPDLVALTQELGQYKPVIIGLDHQEEPHAMRGRYESTGDLIAGEEVYRRPDGGHTVFSDDSKYALTFGLPVEPFESKNADTLTEGVHDFIDDRTDQCFQRGARDLYTGGDQIVGVSQRLKGDSAVVRAYWAEDLPEVYGLMYRDGFSDEEMNRHQRAMEKSTEILGGQDFYKTVMEEFGVEETQDSGEFLRAHGIEPGTLSEQLLEEEGKRERKACFLERG
ncbi:hypothetical protein [Candidatus Nanohalovita haloferacivicina]|uniref:hypothetical protein n=1 Tax=Candidatus Nanohalovita haloferacivicina TaxID=2978046 RepID=UPI00325FA2B1|nr:hypothetical protein HBNXNv_1015 [Candidatus Nanohalobia archaeon BNXNv]